MSWILQAFIPSLSLLLKLLSWYLLKKILHKKFYLQVALVIKNPPASAGDIRDVGLIPGLGRSPGGGNGNPLRYSCLENFMDRGAWRATVLRVAQNQTWLKRLSTLSLLILLHVDIKQEPSQSNSVHPYSILVEQLFRNICKNIAIPF